MHSLLTPIKSLHGIGPALAGKFSRLGLETLEDALLYFPLRHEDWRTQIDIKNVHAGDMVTLAGELTALRTRKLFRRRVSAITEARLEDETASIPLIWFNQPYLQKTLAIGQRYFISGRIETKGESFQMVNPTFERQTADPTHQRLVPVYPSIDGLSQRQIRSVIAQALEFANLIPDHLSTEITERWQLLPRADALRAIHLPENHDVAAAGVRRMQFDELLLWQLRWQIDTDSRSQPAAVAYPFSETAVRSFVQRFPYELTNDQRQAAWEILQSLGTTAPMSRLLQGDVGSGKTIVAAIAAYNVARQGGQVAFLVPTVVLAEQHFATLSTLFAGTDIVLALVTGQRIRSNTAADFSRAGLDQAIRDREVHLVVGTQAILETPLPWAQLGFTIVDEQQRFGVTQRAGLSAQMATSGLHTPHFLSLTATPIPRTLALFLGSELQISRLRTKPAGRQPIRSEVKTVADVAAIDQQIQATVTAGQRVYYITPLIDESDHFGAHAATVEYERLKQTLPDLAPHIGLIHGELSADDRVAVMDDFRSGRITVLVGTTVIEVGVDVPEATLMVVDGAERFGLAQLHQLRGRVGRSSVQSTCIFVLTTDAAEARTRVERVASTDDGLALAEFDLQTRGAGDMYGIRQSGWPSWRMATLSDRELIIAARETALYLREHGQDRAIMMDDTWKAPSGVYHRE